MRRRGLILFGAAAVAVAVASVTLAGQGAPQRTAWGDPDFTGLWRGLSGVSLERAPRFKGRELLNDEEVAAIRKGQEETQARTLKGEVYEFFFRAQSNVNEIFHYDEKLGPISRRTAQIIDPPDGRLPTLTPAAVKVWEAREAMTVGRSEADHWTDRGLGERCIAMFPYGRVSYWGLGDPDVPRPVKGLSTLVEDASVGLEGGGITNRDDVDGSSSDVDRPILRIAQSPGHVVLVDMQPNGLNGEALRTIPIGLPPVSSAIRQNMGVSRGRYEGNTLVIETTNFTDSEPQMATYGIRRYPGTGATLKVTERYTRLAADRLEMRYTVEDPQVYVRPYTALVEWTKDDNFIVPAGLCHENNKDTGPQLAAARADEANAQDVVAEYHVVRQQRLAEIKAEVGVK